LRHSVFASWANGSATLVEGVERVLPGTYLEIQLDALTTRSVSWYDPLEAVDVERAVALGRASREDATRALEAALRSSVRRRLMGDCPIGAMCSGGIDSSLVAAFARDEQPGIHAFNAAIVDQPEWNEADWAELVAREHDLELHTAACDAAGWRAGFVGATLHNEFPLVHPGTVPMAAVASLAHQDGVKVLLSGEGADELFGGYEFLHRRDYADFQVQAAPAAARLRAYAGRALGRQRGLTRLGLRAAGRPLPPGRPPPDPIGGAFPPAVEYVVAGRARAFEAYRHHRGPRRRLEAALAADLRSYLPHLLNRQDKNTMQHSVETRVPFLDPEVVALALNLPLELRMLPLRKGILRDLAARHLPTGVATRPKIGFGFAVKDYFQQARTEFLVDGRMRDVLEVPARDWSALVGGADDDLELLLWSGEVLCRSLGGESAEAIEQALWLDPIGPQAARAKAVIRP
jgi:asparagine synthase (glutamine-hydrolysing)